MRNRKNQQAAAALVAASLAVAMAPAPQTAAPAHFINDQGELMTVDPPSATRKPIFVAIPASSEQAKAAQPAQQSKP